MKTQQQIDLESYKTILEMAEDYGETPTSCTPAFYMVEALGWEMPEAIGWLSQFSTEVSA